MAHTFTREELYALVWSEPMRKVAQKFDISDVGLAKACRHAKCRLISSVRRTIRRIKQARGYQAESVDLLLEEILLRSPGLSSGSACSPSHFDRAEGVLHGPSAKGHGAAGVQSLLHRFDDILMLPAVDAAFLAGRAFSLRYAGAALVGLVAMERSSLIETRALIGEGLSAGW
jgi:hypothetical protein